MKLAIICSLALAGCATGSPEQIAAQQAVQIDADKATCATFGAAPGSDGFAACMVQVQSARRLEQQAAAADRRARMMALGAALQGTGAAMSAAAPAAPTGFTKVCSYNTIMGPRAITVGAMSLCPLLPPS
jgi:hypothetical protein